MIEEIESFFISNDDLDLSGFSLAELKTLQAELNEQIEVQKDIKDIVLGRLSRFPVLDQSDHMLSVIEYGGETLTRLEYLLREIQEHIQIQERINELIKQ